MKKAIEAYERGGVSAVEDLIKEQGVAVEREVCSGCDLEDAPSLPGDHVCLYCGGVTVGGADGACKD